MQWSDAPLMIVVGASRGLGKLLGDTPIGQRIHMSFGGAVWLGLALALMFHSMSRNCKFGGKVRALFIGSGLGALFLLGLGVLVNNGRDIRFIPFLACSVLFAGLSLGFFVLIKRFRWR